MALLLFASPLMACLLPASGMTAEEGACCRHMAQQCGGDDSMSHSCCKKIGGIDSGALEVKQRQSLDVSFAATVLPLLYNVVVPSKAHVTVEPAVSPPESPPATISILRI